MNIFWINLKWRAESTPRRISDFFKERRNLRKRIAVNFTKIDQPGIETEEMTRKQLLDVLRFNLTSEMHIESVATVTIKLHSDGKTADVIYELDY